MTASSSAARRALAVSPFLGHGRALPRSAMLATSAVLTRNARHMLLNKSATALLISARTITTETKTREPGASGPPPGFHPVKARIPPLKETPARTPGPTQAAAAATAAATATATATATAAATAAAAAAAAAKPSPNASASPSSKHGREASIRHVAAAKGSGEPGASEPSDKTRIPSKETPGKTPSKEGKEASGKVAAADGRGGAPTHLGLQKDATAVEKGGQKNEKKETIGQKIKHVLQHYWDGTRLLATEVKISSRLALKMAAGYELTRREYRQLQRTVQDLGRLVPFSVFVIVPFAELLLPIALRLFPNMLPSTFEGQQTKEQKAAALRATRKDVSDFLRTTLVETGLPLTLKAAMMHKEEFVGFFRKVRGTGEMPTAEEVISVCTIFRDDLTLDNLSRPQLVSMCRYLNLNTFGSDTMLRYQTRHRMRQIKRDDRAIADEGVDSLSVAELQTACQARGIRTYGLSPARLREDLQVWLDLRLKHKVPSTLLVLANAYQYGQARSDESNGGFATQIDALTGVLSAIPEELYHEMELQVHEQEGAATNKQRLEVLKEQEELIDEELEQDMENQSTGYATPTDKDFIDDKEDSAAGAPAPAPGQVDSTSR